MAITATNKLATGSGASATSYNTASLSVTSGRLYLLTVRNNSGAGTAATPTVSGAGQTWTQVRTHNDAANSSRRTTLFRCIASSTTSGALTIDFGAQSQGGGAGWIVDEITGTTPGNNGANAIVQDAHDDSNAVNVSTFALALGAFGASGNATYATIYCPNTAAAITPETGYTQLGDDTTGPGHGESEFKASNDTSPSWSLDSRSVAGAIAVELAIASPQTVSPSATSLTLTVTSASIPLASPSTRALTITAATPTIAVGQIVSPITTSLTLSTFAPTVTVAAVPPPSVEARIGWRPEQFNHVTNPDFETNTTGWSVSAGINGAGTSITRITTDAHTGSACGQLVCPATALTGVNYAFGTQPFYAVSTYLSVYRFVVWLKSVSGTTQCRLIVGSNGTSTDRASRDVSLTTEWQPFYLDWAPSATRTDVQIAVVNIPAVAMTARIDDVNFFLRDALTQIENGYFTTDTSGWSVAAGINAAATSITRQSSGGYYGSACGQLVTTATNGSGMNWPMGTAKYTSGRTYRARVMLKSVSGSTSARIRLGSSGTAADRGDSSVTITTDWTAYTVDWTPSADRTDVQIAITNGSAAAVTANVDGVEVYEAIDDVSTDAFGVTGASNLTYGRGTSFDGSSPAVGFANLRVYNAMSGGKYSPENSSSVLYGLLNSGRRILIRAKYAGGPYALFYGSVRHFVPLPMDNACEIRCEDTLNDLARIRYFTAHTETAVHDARVTALQASTVYNYASENGPTERLIVWGGTDTVSLLEYMTALNTATGSLFFVKPSLYASVGWQLVTRDRTVHSDASTPSETWSDDLSDLSGYDVTDEALVNRQRVAVTAYQSREPRLFEQLAGVNNFEPFDYPNEAFRFGTDDVNGQLPPERLPFTIAANTTRDLVFDFSGPIVLVSTQGPDGVSRVVTTSASRVVISATAGATDVAVGDSASSTSVYVYGIPLVVKPINDQEAKDEEGIYLDQEHAGNDISSPFLNHPAYAYGLASHRVWRYKRARARPSATRHNLFVSQLSREISDRVLLTFARLSLASKGMVIMSFSTTVSQNARDWQTTYQLEELPATPSGGWFTLGTSALDGTAKLAY
ncbi:MAG TPA: hypothetical protein VFJ93_07670 [Gaiellaceae bacterium]|nr:hypothetical protein [Gaiellaceae bacterium]